MKLRYALPDLDLPVRTGPGLLILLIAALAGSCERNTEPARQAQGPGLPAISAQSFRDHMEVLATEAMEGREAGTQGFRRAAGYVAAQFREWGLLPLGDHGSFLQEVPLTAARLVPDSSRFVLRKGGDELELVFGDDFVTHPGFGDAAESVNAPLAFVGYGVHAPHHDHDDFAGIDVAGKILLRLTGAPSHFPTDERAFFSSSWVKNTMAVERGAVGVVTIRAPVDLQRLPWERYLSALGSAEMRWTRTDGEPFEAFAELAGEAVLSESGVGKVFAFAGHDPAALFTHHEAGGTGSFDLAVSAGLARQSEQESTSAPNVIALIEGSDAVLREEFVLYTAHLDHLGIRPAAEGDQVHYGAYDNAAGVATILEVARALAEAERKPRRSVIFVALTAEEKGLQGSSYLAHHPPVPIDRIVANINIDMPYLGFPIAEIEGLGVEHSSLQAALARAATAAGLELIPDSRPELVRFIRSDQFSFVRQGVPGLNLKPGARSSDPALDGPALLAAYLHDHYHRPSDDMALPFSPEAARKFVAVARHLGLEVANGEERPRWNHGDFFGIRFAQVNQAP